MNKSFYSMQKSAVSPVSYFMLKSKINFNALSFQNDASTIESLGV